MDKFLNNFLVWTGKRENMRELGVVTLSLTAGLIVGKLFTLTWFLVLFPVLCVLAVFAFVVGMAVAKFFKK